MRKKTFRDGLTAYPQMPGLVLLPENEEETVKIIKIVKSIKFPLFFEVLNWFIWRSHPHKSGVLLVMSKLNKIIEVDPNNRIAKVQPGLEIFLFLRVQTNLVYIMLPTHQVRLHVQLVEILQKIQVEYIASNTD